MSQLLAGISFFGSRNGIGVTVAIRAPFAQVDLVPELGRPAGPDTGSLFERSPGRVVPDWLEHLLPAEH
jgi:hypothetical protein